MRGRALPVKTLNTFKVLNLEGVRTETISLETRKR